MNGSVDKTRPANLIDRTAKETCFKNTLLEAQFETAIDGILIVDPQNRALTHNTAFVQMWHLPKTVISTGNDKVFLKKAMKQLKDPAEFIARVKDLYKHHDQRSFERIELKNDRFFDRYSSPIFDPNDKYLGRIWYFRDVSDEVHANMRTHDSENKFRTLFDNTADSIFIVGMNRRFVEANRTACSRLGYSKAELLELSPLDIASPGSRSTVEQKIRSVIKKGAAIFEAEHITKDGRIIPAEINAHTAIINNRPVIIAVCRDTTERKQLTELQNLDRLKDDFLNIATHELRTPLTSIIGMSEIVAEQNKNLTADQIKYINIIHDEGERLSRTIKQILNVTSIEHKRSSINKTKFAIKEFAEKILPILEAIGKNKNAKITISLQNIKKGILMTDREKISQIIYDMVDNAVKFGAPNQTVKINISQLNDRETRFEVIDEGPGIPKDKIENLFKKFGQLDTALSRSQEGIGLGLYTAKKIIEGLSGEIGVTSKPGHGSTFWFTIPF